MIRKMPCPVTVRSGITSKDYEDVIGKSPSFANASVTLGKKKRTKYEDIIG